MIRLVVLFCWLLVLAGAPAARQGAVARDPLAEPTLVNVGDARSINDGIVTALAQDPAGLIWVGTWNGLARRLRGETRFTPVLTQGTDNLTGRTVSMLGQAPDGALWVGTRAGDLLRLNASTLQAQWLDRGDTGGKGVVSMAVAHEGEVWVGREGGIDLRGTDGRLLKRLERDLRRPWGVGGNNVVALLRDASGGLWVGSYGGGLQRHSANPGLWVRRGEGASGAVFEEGDVRSLLQLRSGAPGRAGPGACWPATTARCGWARRTVFTAARPVAPLSNACGWTTGAGSPATSTRWSRARGASGWGATVACTTPCRAGTRCSVCARCRSMISSSRRCWACWSAVAMCCGSTPALACIA
jgi:hypothetical protein